MNPLSFLLAPFALFLLSLLPLVVIMYLLKLKRRPERVASTLLWRRSVEDLVANAPFQKLRNNLLLWLQLLILLLLILALARPLLRVTGMKGESLIVLIDLSASMQTVEDNGRTRLDEAKRLALEEVEKMRGSSGILRGEFVQDEMMVLGFAGSTFPLQSMTTDKAALRAAINSAEPFDTEANMSDAALILQEKTMMLFEGDAMTPKENVRVILISDGGIGPSVSALTDIPNVDFVLVGSTTNNVGFTNVDVRESFVGSFSYEVFATLINSTPEPKTVFVELSIETTAVDLKSIELQPNVETPIIFSVGEGMQGLGRLALVDHRDAFRLDDDVSFRIAPPSEIRILLVTRGNPFMESVLGIDPRVTVSTIRPVDYRERGDVDITVFDNFSPTELGSGNFIFINSIPPESTGYRSGNGATQNPQVVDWDRVHPLTRFVNFDRVLIGEGRLYEAPRGSVSILQSPETDLISYHETDSRRVLVIGFDILRSYWPLDVSFPIFFANLMDLWSRNAVGAGRPSYGTGETISIVPPREASIATVTTARGDALNYNIESATAVYLTETYRKGLYTVKFDKGLDRVLPVNLQSRQESRITPIGELSFGGRVVSASDGASAAPREIWAWLALIGLGVLMAEWLIYCRRTFM